MWRHKACVAWKNSSLGRYELMWASGCLAQTWIEFVWFQKSSFWPQSKKATQNIITTRGLPNFQSWGNKLSTSLPDLRSMVSSLGRWQQTLSMVEQSNLPSFAAFVRESPWQVCEILGIWNGSFSFTKLRKKGSWDLEIANQTFWILARYWLLEFTSLVDLLQIHQIPSAFCTGRCGHGC